MFKKLRNFIRKIQKSDLKTRKKWFFVFSASLFFVILVLWFFYLNFFFNFDLNNDDNNEIGFLKKINQEWLTFKKGYTELSNKFKEKTNEYLGDIKEKIEKKKEIDIKSTTTVENNEEIFKNETTSEEVFLKFLENLMLVLTSTTSTIQTSTMNINN